LLPSSTWLKANGFCNVTSIRARHPEAFAHLKRKQERARGTLAENVAKAEKLAEENGGLLPSGKWLKNNGYYNIRNLLQKHPESIAHLKREILLSRRPKGSRNKK